MVLPSFKFIGIRNAENKLLGCLPGRGFSKYDLKFSEPNVLSPNVKFEVEPSTHDAGMVHIRSCLNNKYWTRWCIWVVPTAEKKDEDKSKESCTLFNFIPVDAAAGTFKIIHVQSGYNLCLCNADLSTSSDGTVYCFHESYAGPRFDTFTVIDLGSILSLPSYVAFKAPNGKYLTEGAALIKPSTTDMGAEGVACEIFPTKDGEIRIMTLSSKRFWTLDFQNTPIVPTNKSRNDIDVMFHPVKVDGNTIALKSMSNNQFCQVSGNCLQATSPYVVNESRITLEEAFLNREIIRSRYDVDKARIYNQSVVNKTEVSVRNPYGMRQNMSVKLKYKDDKSRTWRSSYSVKLGITANMEFEIPFIGRGGVQVSTEVHKMEEWGKTHASDLEVEIEHDVEVPPYTMLTVRLTATQATVDVPFSYTQIDTLHDGTIIQTKVTDAYFTGSNCYNLTFDNIEQSIAPKPEPIAPKPEPEPTWTPPIITPWKHTIIPPYI